mmetsp:Transcript_41847/g.65392  ORF Transcript_41847/g.65392 Transcript_41847/m.65392 type:complete len:161 (+) Transcript_41847:438-920(+)
MIWATYFEHWEPVKAFYFAVNALATGGLEAPTLAEDGTLEPVKAVTVAIYCLIGVPIFAFNLGAIASSILEGIIRQREREAISKPMSRSEFDRAASIVLPDKTVDKAEFIVFELLRLGKTDLETVELILQEFEAYDKDKNGVLTPDEVFESFSEFSNTEG